MLNKKEMRVWIGFIWLRKGFNHWLLWRQVMEYFMANWVTIGFSGTELSPLWQELK